MSNNDHSLTRKLYYAAKMFVDRYNAYRDRGDVDSVKRCNNAFYHLEAVLDDFSAFFS